jgi:hypothetical protein
MCGLAGRYEKIQKEDDEVIFLAVSILIFITGDWIKECRVYPESRAVAGHIISCGNGEKQNSTTHIIRTEQNDH